VADCDIRREVDLDELVIAGRPMENHSRHRLIYAPLTRRRELEACCSQAPLA
jgi:hypothetical protein